MAETTLDLVKEFRRLTDDYGDHAGNDAGWIADDADCIWKNEEIVRYLNQAQEEYVGSAPIVDSKTVAVCQVTVLAGTASALLHPAVRAVLFCKRATDGVKLARKDARFIDEQEAEDGEPKYWALDYSDSEDQRHIYVFPTPAVDTTLELRVERGPLTPLAWDTPAGRPEIPSNDHLRLVQWALHLAYQRSDSDAFDAAKAQRHLELWQFYVGPNDNETDRRNIRREIQGGVIRTTATYR